MFAGRVFKFRLRPFFPSCRHYYSIDHGLVYRRLADRTHRSAYASIERETRDHRKPHSVLKLKPSVPHFLLWLRRKQERKLDHTVLRENGLPLLYKEPAILEVALFHISACLHSDEHDTTWLDSQLRHLSFICSHLSKRQRNSGKNRPTFTYQDADYLASLLAFKILSQQREILLLALQCTALGCPTVTLVNTLVPWVKSLLAPRITDACAELSNLTYIPASVTSDILLRTPMSVDELALQLDLWHTFIDVIAQENHAKKAHVASIIENLTFYTVQFDPRKLETFLDHSLKSLTSTKTGYLFHVMTDEFINSVIYLLAITFIQNGSLTFASPMPIIKAQKVLAEYLGHSRLLEKGYVGITLLISHEEPEKALKLLQITQSHYPHQSDLIFSAKIYLSQTPEELLHHFNVAVLQYPNSATLWLMLAKKLHQLHLLTETRSHKLLSELLARKNQVIISKSLILILLAPIESINGVEDFIHLLLKAGLFEKYQNAVLNKYMSLLYRYSEEKSVHKPYLDTLIRESSNLECARYLYRQIQWKTISIIGVMLNGEVNHKPGELYQVYQRELQGHVPDESCLSALLRASTKRSNGQPFLWGKLYAPQVAVHEFKQHVQNGNSKDSTSIGVAASNKLWQVYIHALKSAEYTGELAEIMRWWELVRFIPSRSTLMLLLRALPVEFSERHIKHAQSLPKSSTTWPWPTLDEFRE